MNYAIGWEQPSPEQLMIQAEEEQPTSFVGAFTGGHFQLTPTQARRLHMRYMLKMKYREIAEAEESVRHRASDSRAAGREAPAKIISRKESG